MLPFAPAPVSTDILWLCCQIISAWLLAKLICSVDLWRKYCTSALSFVCWLEWTGDWLLVNDISGINHTFWIKEMHGCKLKGKELDCVVPKQIS